MHCYIGTTVSLKVCTSYCTQQEIQSETRNVKAKDMIIPHIKIVKNLPESFIPALPNVVLILFGLYRISVYSEFD
jgi:hypothetical protein